MTDTAVPAPRPAEETADQPDAERRSAVAVSSPDLPDLGTPTPPPATPSTTDLRLLADVPVEVSAEIARLRLPLQSLLELARGSVVELDRDVDSPVDLLVNGTLVARGEVVVVDGRLAVRVLSLIGR